MILVFRCEGGSDEYSVTYRTFLSFYSLASTLHVALGKCLGTAGTLRLPLLMPYRCIAPGEKNSVTFTFKYDPSKFPQGNFTNHDFSNKHSIEVWLERMK